jgi:hypothetical protein
VEACLQRDKSVADQESGSYANDKQSHAIPLLGSKPSLALLAGGLLILLLMFYLLRKSVKRSLSVRAP